jgi:branched-chain amino acid transport system permease protein
VCLYFILAQAFNLSFGVGGLFNLAHVASFALGAYVTALASIELETSFFSCVILSMGAAALFSLLLGAISLRLEHDYFAIGTLAFASLVSAILINWKTVTRGVLGIPGIPRPVLWGHTLQDNGSFLLLVFIAALLSNIFFWILWQGSFGRVLRAQAEFPQACTVLGREVRLIKISAFALSSAFAGLAGLFYAYYISYIDPSSFALREMIFVLTIVLVGRPGSFWGCLFSVIFLVLLPEGLRFLEIPSHILGPLRQLLYSIVLFSVLLLRRHHIFPKQREI